MRFSIWDDWELLEEYDTNNVRTAAYLQGAHGVIKSLTNNIYYYQDNLGSTTHIANASGALLESYRYDLYGTPSYYDQNGQLKANQVSGYGVNDLYVGERWVSELRVYDLRNRFMSPELGRFLQTDPIGFKGDSGNLYRYCGNDPVDRNDPTGTDYESSIDPHDSNHVIIKVPIVWRGNGSAADKAALVRGLETRWTKTFADGRTYTTRVVSANEAARERTNYITLHNSNGSSATKRRLGDWYTKDPGGLENLGAHEGGHLLGREDGYKRIPGDPFRRAQWDDQGPVPKSGYDRDNVMVNPSGSPNRADFEAIEHGNGEGAMGDSSRGARRAFDSFGSTTAAAAAWESSWGNGGWLALEGAPVDRNQGR